MITIQNTFHGTEVTIRASVGQQLTKWQTLRARKELCGVSGCQCGAEHRDPHLYPDYTGEQDGVFLPTFYARGSI
jgi:hypothetical protein